MAYRIDFRPAARRDLRRIPDSAKRRLLATIAALADTPRPPASIRLQGPEGFHRVRIGDYRVVYLIQDRVLLIVIVRVGHRKDVYRGL